MNTETTDVELHYENIGKEQLQWCPIWKDGEKTCNRPRSVCAHKNNYICTLVEWIYHTHTQTRFKRDRGNQKTSRR